MRELLPLGCSAEEEEAEPETAMLKTPPVLGGQEGALQLDSPTARWALESFWMRVHGRH